VLSLNGCVTSTGGYSDQKYSVGPGAITDRSSDDLKVALASLSAVDLSVLITPFDPGLPKNSADYIKKGIWPELRRAEGNRFAIKLRDALDETRIFEAVRVAPATSATGQLYISGIIEKSNGEDIKLRVTATSISGRQLIRSKLYSYRVNEYELQNPRNQGGHDLYEPIFTEIALDIAKVANRLKYDEVEKIKVIEELRFAESFSPEYFSKYLVTSTECLHGAGRGSCDKITKLVSSPAQEDAMLKRTKALRVRDKLFIDNVQADYDNFSRQMTPEYLLWQKDAYTESSASRKANRKGIAKKILGIAAVTGGLVLAATADAYSGGGQALTGLVLAGAGVAAVSSGMTDTADAKMHSASLNELGSSLNVTFAPRVMEMEDKTIELEGDAKEQYQTWRDFLQDLYDLEATPDVVL
jgi:hypothetical protein